MQPQTLRQILIIAGITLCNMSDGFIFGQMSGMLDALHRKDSTMKITEDELALIAAMINVTCICGFVVVGITTEIFGRRKAITFLTIPVVICWIVIYFVQDKIILLITRVIVGVSYGGILLICHICVGEYSSPMKRSIIFNITSVGQLAGVTLGHILSLVLNWRYVALIGLIPSLLSCVMPMFWVESPSWLASKGRFEECRKAFKMLHVMDEDHEDELKHLIAFETRKHHLSKAGRSFNAPIKKLFWACRQKYLWKVIILSLISNIYRIAAGRILFSTLAITIFRDFTGYSNIWGVTLLVDGLGILGALFSCVLVSLFKKLRALLFIFGGLGNLFLLLLSAVCHFTDDKNMDDIIVWIKASLLALYFVIVNSGAYPVLETLLTEIYPLEAKAFCIFIVGTAAGILQFLAIKFAPSMFRNLGYDGTFFTYAVIVIMCLGYLWKFMPETKGKTLQDIEVYFKEEVPKSKLVDDFVFDPMVTS